MSGQPIFNQQGWEVHGDVYNTAGDLILTKGSTPQDLAKVLQDVKAQLAGLDGLPDEDRRELELEVEQAVAEALQPDPPKEEIIGRLARIRRRLGELDGIAGGALALGKTVAGIAGWVGTVL